jgi:hypothetical protein
MSLPQALKTGQWYSRPETAAPPSSRATTSPPRSPARSPTAGRQRHLDAHRQRGADQRRDRRLAAEIVGKPVRVVHLTTNSSRAA